MGLRVYKPEQGYWTRVLSTAGGLAMTLAGVGWLWDKLARLSGAYVTYLQAGVAVVVTGVLGLLVYYFVWCNPRTSDFLIATEGEMKKVNWPDRKEIVGSTWVVIICTVLLATLLFVADAGFIALFQWMGILEN